MNNEFIPVILGIDVGAYSVARTIYEHYKIKSIVIGKYTYWMTKYSKITDVLTIDNIKDDFMKTFEKCEKVTYETIKKEKWYIKIVGNIMKFIAPLI